MPNDCKLRLSIYNDNLNFLNLSTFLLQSPPPHPILDEFSLSVYKLEISFLLLKLFLSWYRRSILPSLLHQRKYRPPSTVLSTLLIFSKFRDMM